MAKKVFGPGPKKKDQPKSKIGGGIGTTTVAPGYKMALVRKQEEPSTRTKTIAGGPVGTKVTTPVGINAPMPVSPAKKVAAAPTKKSPSSVGKVIKSVGKAASKVGDAITPDKNTFNLKKARRTSGRGNKGGGPLKCFKY